MADHSGCRCGSGAHPRRCEKHPWAYDQHVSDLNHEALRDELEELKAAVMPDHGISPAQLRDKVASLDDESEVQAQRLNAIEDSSHKLREKVEALEAAMVELRALVGVGLDSHDYDTVRNRLDAALKRIDQLESQQARWRGTNRYTDESVADAPSTPPPRPHACSTCGARRGDAYTDREGHFLVNDDPCPQSGKEST